MAYERVAIKNELKMNLNYGEVGGKIIAQTILQPGGASYQKLRSYEFVDKTVRKEELVTV